MDISLDGESLSDFEKIGITDTAKGKSVEYIGECATVEDAILNSGLDLKYWEVAKSNVSYWGQKLGVQMNSVKVEFRPKKYIAETDTILKLIERLEGKGPKRAKMKPKGNLKDPVMVEIGLFDAHFGKLVTGESEDVTRVQDMWMIAVEDIIDRTKQHNVEKWLLPIGNDLLHVDNKQKTTTKGTIQDMGCSFEKMIEIAYESVLDSVALMSKKAPVKIIWTKGNHDTLTSWFLCKMLQSYFSRDENVEVSVDMDCRQYVRYGVTLIGFTHGNNEKKTELPMLMVREAGIDFHETTYQEFHTGHFHGEESKTVGGITIRVLGALSGTDYWHEEKGYCMNHRSAEAFVISKEDGLIAHLFVKFGE